MREILFRGKSLKTGKWTQGYLFRCWERAYILWGMVNDNADMTEVHPETVCQYTGLTDKCGNKIFENDIIECRRKDRRFQSQIEWDCKCGGFMFQDSKEGSMVGLDSLLDGGIYNDFEVIGNIFDNPELLQGVGSE